MNNFDFLPDTLRAEYSMPDLSVYSAEFNLATRYLDSDARIRFWSDFQSSVEIPYPASATGWSIDDIAAVVAGSKPATILGKTDIYGERHIVHEFFQAQGYRLRPLALEQTTSYYGDKLWFLGRAANVAILAALYEGRGGAESPLPADEAFHRTVGETLGYATEAIDLFVDRLQ